jgi:hypothetical protein
MTASDEFSKLAARAKEAEDHAAAARTKARGELEQDVNSARITAQEHAQELRHRADRHKGRISDWWDDVQENWNEHIVKVRKQRGSRKAEHDAERAEKRAQRAEDDAAFAVAYAIAAIEEAEYSVLDAALARLQADDLVAGART